MLPVLVQLGFWQWHRAEAKRQLQQRADAQAKAPPLALEPRLIGGDGLLYRHVKVHGRFEAGHQILLDNQVHGEQAGFDVLTPLRIDGGEVRVLVDRGWVPLGSSREALPEAAPPAGPVEVSGTVWRPAARKPPAANQAGAVWQVLDLARYGAQVPYPLQPFAIRLDPAAVGCYVCDWPRADDKVAMHLGYAWQWWGMAGVLLAFYVFAGMERGKA